MVFDVAITYERMQHNKNNKTVDQDLYSQDQLQELMNQARGVKSDGNNSKK
jgi:hypothetical protein